MFLYTNFLKVTLLSCAVLAIAGCNDELDTNDNSGDTSEEVMNMSSALVKVDQQTGKIDHSSSVGGMDSSYEGVRTDVKEYTDQLPDSEAQKRSLLQLSQAISVAIQMGANGNKDDTRLRQVTDEIGRGVGCVWLRYDSEQADDKVRLIEKVTANTPERFKAYMKYCQSISGFAFKLSKEEDSCND
ncbi:MAG: hypothetical protein ACTMIA_11625 [Vibrio sp.]